MSSRLEHGQGAQNVSPRRQTDRNLSETGPAAQKVPPRGLRGLPGGICNASILGLKDIIVTAGTPRRTWILDTNTHISASV